MGGYAAKTQCLIMEAAFFKGNMNMEAAYYYGGIPITISIVIIIFVIYLGGPGRAKKKKTVFKIVWCESFPPPPKSMLGFISAGQG